jgi:DNA polymerase-1
VSYAETERGYARFKRRFPGYADMARKFAAFVSEHGYVDTLFGRRLYLPRNKPYVGTNYVIQGSEAGVLKRAQIRVDEYLRRATGGEAGIILPIHDELIIEWPRARLTEARGCLRDVIALMVDFPQSSVPLEVDVKIGTRDWASLKGYEV